MDPRVSGLAKNVVDINPNAHGVYAHNFRHVDYSYPIGIGELFVVAAKNSELSNRVLEGVFDRISYGFILISLVLLGFALWLLERRDGLKTNVFETLFLTFGLLTNECLDSNNPRLVLKSAKYFITFISLTFFFLTSMYNSIIISILTARDSNIKIDSVYDLVTKFKDKRIFLTKDLDAHNMFKKSPYYDTLLPRIDFVPLEDLLINTDVLASNYEKVHKGSHVLLEFASNIEFLYGEKLPHQFICKYPHEKLRYSSQLVSWTLFAWMFRKDFSHRNFIDMVG